jgi:ankyrin repeat protein
MYESTHGGIGRVGNYVSSPDPSHIMDFVNTVNTRVVLSGKSYIDTRPAKTAVPSDLSKYSDKKSPNPADLLRVYIAAKDIEKVKKMLQSVDVKHWINNTADNGDRALDVAVRYKSIDIVKLLLDSGANPNQIKQLNLDVSSSEICKIVDDKKLIIEEKRKTSEDIRYADHEELKEILENLHLNNPALLSDALKCKEDKQTPLVYAVVLGDVESIKLLLHYGANPKNINADNTNSDEILTIAQAYNIRRAANMVKKINEYKKMGSHFLPNSLNYEDINGETLLDIAIKSNDIKAIELMLQCGADPTKIKPANLNSSSKEVKAIIEAENWRNTIHSKIVKKESILSRILEIIDPQLYSRILNNKDINGKTLLDIAIKSNNIEAVRLLLHYGADSEDINTDNEEILAIVKAHNLRKTDNIKKEADFSELIAEKITLLESFS